MLADGTVSMEVEGKIADRAHLRVIQRGHIRSHQGINLPGVKLSAPAISEHDRAHAIWAAGAGVDFVGLSFVRSPDDVRELKEILKSHGSTARVVAKIEKREALDQLEAIVSVADAIMVARGDLGVEIDVAQMPDRAKANHRDVPTLSAADDHRDADAREHARLAAAHAGRSHRRGQRDSRRRRRLHALRRNRGRQVSSRSRPNDEPHRAGHRVELPTSPAAQPRDQLRRGARHHARRRACRRPNGVRSGGQARIRGEPLRPHRAGAIATPQLRADRRESAHASRRSARCACTGA